MPEADKKQITGSKKYFDINSVEDYRYIKAIVVRLAGADILGNELIEDVVNDTYVEILKDKSRKIENKSYYAFYCMKAIKTCLKNQVGLNMIKAREIKDFQQKVDYMADKENISVKEAKYVVRVNETIQRGRMYKEVNVSSLRNEASDDESDIDDDVLLSHYKPVEDNPESLNIKKEYKKNIKMFFNCLDRWKSSRPEKNIEQDYYIMVCHYFKNMSGGMISREIKKSPNWINRIISQANSYMAKCVRNRAKEKYGYDIFTERSYGLL